MGKEKDSCLVAELEKEKKERKKKKAQPPNHIWPVAILLSQGSLFSTMPSIPHSHLNSTDKPTPSPKTQTFTFKPMRLITQPQKFQTSILINMMNNICSKASGCIVQQVAC
jgi:hypothetical protein